MSLKCYALELEARRRRWGCGVGVDRRTVNGLSLSVRVEGAGSPLLLVHGFPLNRTMWDDVIPLLEAWHLLVPDLRGLGQSDAPEAGYAMASYADDLAALLDSYSVDRVAFCGLSMGGYVGFEMLRRHPDRVGAILFLATHPFEDSPEVKATRSKQIEMVEQGGSAQLMDGLLQKLVAPSALAEGAPVVDAVRAILSDAQPRGLAGALMAMRERSDSSPILPHISVPTLVLHGTEDLIIPIDRAREYASRIPGARFVAIEGSGHMVPMEAPAETAAAIRDFLATAG
jgi:pimeloyl-ACP methyl ester carboxylesterase